MEFLQFQNLLCFSLLILSLSKHAKADVDEYFVDCGSSSSTTVDDGRNFTGDSTSFTGVKLLAKHSSLAKDTGNQPELYRTAVIFNSPGSYQFRISESGTYILRLHFYAFSSSAALTAARFNVSASGRLLLPNLSGKASLNSLVLKEFLLTVNKGEFNLFFVPSSPSMVAFVNAIELFIANTTVGTPVVISSGWLQSDLVSSALMPVHRINFGGQTVSPASDSLWRTWIPDDPYLVTKMAAKDGPVRVSSPDYQDGNATYFDAPDAVYNSAKELNLNSSNPPNATWSFNVSRNSIYFIRVHFYDIISLGSGAIMFNLFIHKDFGWKVDPYEIAQGSAPAPFYLDFLMKSDDSGFVNISIGYRNDTRIDKNAFLNGIEFMEVVSASVTEPEISGNSNGKKGKVGLVVGLVAGVVGLIAVLAACLCCIRRRKKASRVEGKPAESFNWPLVPFNGSSESKLTERTASIPSLHVKLRIPFAEIQQITNNFDERLVVGEGGFGKVYKGAVLKKGMKVAVKRSDSRHGQGFPEFLAEVTVLSKIRHRHLVQLIGYCDDNNEMVLVYEFMEMGTLRDHLYSNSNSLGSLSWKLRLEICIGAAKGLHYLHTGAVGGIIHRDVKSSNILLDDNYVAKVSDFGLSRPTPQDYVSTDVKGTFGYLDPEYCQCLQLTEKSDVYSFGVVLLEVVCARQAVNRLLPKEEVNLADWAMACKASGGVEAIVDPTLAGKVEPSSLKKFVETAEKCLRETGSDRPAMSDVLWDLEYALQLQRHGAGASATDVSINMPMLDIPSFTTNNTFPCSMDGVGPSMSGVSGMYGASGEDSTEQPLSYNQY